MLRISNCFFVLSEEMGVGIGRGALCVEHVTSMVFFNFLFAAPRIPPSIAFSYTLTMHLVHSLLFVRGLFRRHARSTAHPASPN